MKKIKKKQPLTRQRKSNKQTREHILTIAQGLFADAGYKGVPVRAITEAAGVNISSISYYFGSKKGLLEAVCMRCVEPINLERKKLLKECKQRQKCELADIIEAFVAPAIRATFAHGEGENAYRRLLGQLFVDPSPEVKEVIGKLYNKISREFIVVLRDTCTDISDEALYWALACIYGSIIYAQADMERVRVLMGRKTSYNNSETALRYMVPFLSKGFEAVLQQSKKKH